jgi:hypothetical protein
MIRTVAIARLVLLTAAISAHAESGQVYLSCFGSEHAILGGGRGQPTPL